MIYGCVIFSVCWGLSVPYFTNECNNVLHKRDISLKNKMKGERKTLAFTIKNDVFQILFT